ncbi:MAG: hypothetical protein OEV36_09340 [Myxococcales bacterium]|nr:hypothetical protein [Myxococcales bacterium]
MSTRLVLRARPSGAQASDMLAPSVGIFAAAVSEGMLVSPGQVIGCLEVLGVSAKLVVPEGVAGRVTQRAGGARARVPVQYGDVLVRVSAESLGEVSPGASRDVVDGEGASFFVAPMSGRFYGSPSPSEPPFVMTGDTVQHGQTVGLLEVMKTFNRLVYKGDSLPKRAVIERIVPNDGDDVLRGDPILALRSVAES